MTSKHDPVSGQDSSDDIDLSSVMHTLAAGWKTIGVVAVLSGCVGLGLAFALPPIYTARAVILPPQQQSGVASAFSSLGALAGLAGGSVKSPVDQYIGLMSSTTVSDRIIDAFDLMQVYKEDYRVDARKELAKKVVITAGKKDGMISIEVDDQDPKRAASMANAYIDGLRFMTNTLAVSEAQQRRIFFEIQLKETKENLTKAQIQLQASGYNPGAMKAEPKAAAEGYAKLRADLTAAEVKLQSLRRLLADSAPEIIQQQAMVSALRSELQKIERSDSHGGSQDSADYITKYREYKYQETLFELFARQYESARVDESREGALIQVVDPASPPEKKTKPKRTMIVAGFTAIGLIFGALWVGIRHRQAGHRAKP